MANAIVGNKIYIESTGTVTTKRTLVAYIIFTPDTGEDQMILHETDTGSPVLLVSGSVAKDTKLFDFSAKPLVFENGIHIGTLTSGAKATLVTTTAGK